jgi:heterodisulfide reductase subunit A
MWIGPCPPKSIDESITQAQAAAARAVSLLSEKKKYVSGAVANINQVNCSG